MNEVEHSDVSHLIRLRIALEALVGVIPFGAMKHAETKHVTRTIAEWVSHLEVAVAAHCDEDAEDASVWDGWIPEARRKPEEGEKVLFAYIVIRDGQPGVTVGHYDDPEGWWDALVVGDGMRMTDTVTHWRPFPALPNESGVEMSEAEIAMTKIRGILVAGGYSHSATGQRRRVRPGARASSVRVTAQPVTTDEAVSIVADLIVARNATGWRSVDHDELPTASVDVLIAWTHGITIGRVFRGRRMTEDGELYGDIVDLWLFAEGTRVPFGSVTHWRSLPGRP